MILNRVDHEEIFSTDKYQTECSRAGLKFLRTHDVAIALRPQAMSVWMTHAVIRFAASIGDFGWTFARNTARATNRAHRETARSFRSTLANCPTGSEDTTKENYCREFDTSPQRLHCVAVSHDLQIIDPTFWLWSEPELDIQASRVLWLAHEKDQRRTAALRGAIWEHYRVHVEDELTKHVAASSEAAKIIDRVLFS